MHRGAAAVRAVVLLGAVDGEGDLFPLVSPHHIVEVTTWDDDSAVAELTGSSRHAAPYRSLTFR